MVDPVTVLQTAEAVGGLIKIFNEVRRYCVKLYKAPREIQEVLQGLDDGLCETLLGIRNLLHDRALLPEVSECDSLICTGLRKATNKCELSLLNIQEILRRFIDDDCNVTATSASARMAFVKSAPEINKHLKRVAGYKHTLSLALGSLTWSHSERSSMVTFPVSSSSESITLRIDTSWLLRGADNNALNDIPARSHTSRALLSPTYITLPQTAVGSTIPVSIGNDNIDRQIADAFLESVSTLDSSYAQDVELPSFDGRHEHSLTLTTNQATSSNEHRRDSGASPLELHHPQTIGLSERSLPTALAATCAEDEARKSPNPFSTLRKAVKDSDIELVKLLLNGGMDINTVDEGGSALHYAAAAGHEAMTGFLLQQDGLDVNLRDRNSQTALSKAIQKERISVVRLLVTMKGREIITSTRHDYNGSLLHYAAKQRQTTCSSLLLSVDPSLRDTEDRTLQTPLHYAAQAMCVNQVRLLLSKGADADKKDAEDRTPMYVALASDKTPEDKILQALEEHGGTEGTKPLTKKMAFRLNSYRQKRFQADTGRRATFSGPSSGSSGRQQDDRQEGSSQRAVFPSINFGRRWSKT